MRKNVDPCRLQEHYRPRSKNIFAVESPELSLWEARVTILATSIRYSRLPDWARTGEYSRIYTVLVAVQLSHGGHHTAAKIPPRVVGLSRLTTSDSWLLNVRACIN
jgi:hypothetical protein